VITRLEGSLYRLDSTRQTCEVDVQGVTYELLVPAFLWPGLVELADGSKIAFEVHYSVSANNPTPLLIGFLRRSERDFFRKFLTVEDIGPVKAARAMNVSVSTIARAIEGGDVATLRRLPGVGERTAQKIVATLKGKVTVEARRPDRAGRGARQAQRRGCPRRRRHRGQPRLPARAGEALG
jgi:Holliday junction DNA helicase RuvA